MGYSIGQVARKTGLTTHTLRYYEKEGLLPFVRKNSSGLRVFSDNDLGWLAMIECLKKPACRSKASNNTSTGLRKVIPPCRSGWKCFAGKKKKLKNR